MKQQLRDLGFGVTLATLVFVVACVAVLAGNYAKDRKKAKISEHSSEVRWERAITSKGPVLLDHETGTFYLEK